MQACMFSITFYLEFHACIYTFIQLNYEYLWSFACRDIEQDLMNSDEPDEVPDQPQPVLGDIKIRKDEQPSQLPSGDIRFKQKTECVS